MTADAKVAILEAADRLYNARGVQSVGMDELRTAAGVSLKRLYQLYPSKEDIIVAVLAARHRAWVEGLDAAVAAAATPREQLLAVYDVLGQWFCDPEFRGCAFINTFAELGAVSPRLAEIAREHKRDFQATTAELVRRAGAPASLAPQLSILAEGAQTTAAIAGTPDAAAQARDAAAVLVDAALGAVPAGR
ncbi:TetR/AcrR family transcriptional regulator [Homoserinibacter sp. YIM 151385]|uniref:TetR/AcrR family transcriptional regulator n=1 Tax=Homoserinibacter sp. YIM 151385 TaxID=2985506 RepID=UPI0022F036D3|nr:TetR/AcrR family transcriptional regulator [Homoserinibacter sp. YIM 151385]WBU39124.1 TetR/AcrR family transcriptional regulator [Homoserinibacter sp. YIM 151385]